MLPDETIYTGLSSLSWLWYLGLDTVLRGPPNSQPICSMPESIRHLNISPFYWGGGTPNPNATKLFHYSTRNEEKMPLQCP